MRVTAGMGWPRQCCAHVNLSDNSTGRDKTKYGKESDSFRMCAERNLECNFIPRETCNLCFRIVDVMIDKVLSRWCIHCIRTNTHMLCMHIKTYTPISTYRNTYDTHTHTHTNIYARILPCVNNYTHGNSVDCWMDIRQINVVCADSNTHTEEGHGLYNWTC